LSQHVPPQRSREEALKVAWQLHSALADSTRGVDSKASFALTLESAALGGIAVLSSSPRLLGRVSGGFPTAFLWLGVALLGVAATLAVLVVIPRHARQGRSPDPGPDEFIFYGHLRHWAPDELAARLIARDALPALTHQLVTMSAILWTKQRRVRESLTLAVAGAVLVTVAGLWS
jgi:hypothetical protein